VRCDSSKIALHPPELGAHGVGFKGLDNGGFAAYKAMRIHGNHRDTYPT
jgi:hypothetical protein